MRDTGTVARHFAAHSGLAQPEPAPDLPALLALPLRERLLLVDRGEVSAARWQAQADAWSVRADGRYRACADLRPLPPSGLPVAVGVKDTVDVAGLPTRLGLRRHRHHPLRSAAVVERLSAASINAKVVTTELNIGIGSGCVNPYLPHLDPAGSSTGSAVAVAAGICDLSLGTDVLGSVRWPAGRCGVVGLRVTHDERLLPGVFPLSPAMDAPGWVARTADDMAVLWDRLGLGPGTVVPAGPRPSTVGVVAEVLDGDAEPEILEAVARTTDLLRAAGHEVQVVSAGEPWQWRGAAWELCARDAWDGFRSWREWIRDDLSESTMRALEAGAAVADARLAEIRAGMAAQRGAVPALFRAQGVDAWLLPLDPSVPRPRPSAAAPASSIPRPGEPGYDEEVGYTPLASFAGLPAITFPVGRGAEHGVPLAMQLVGPPQSEPGLIRLARDVGDLVGPLGFAPR